MSKRLFFVVGPELFARQNQIQQWVQQWLEPEWQALNLEKHDGAQGIAPVIDGWLTPPFWGSRRMLIAELQAEPLGELLSELGTRFASGLPDTQNILVISAERLDKRRKGLKALLQQAELVEFGEVKRWNVERELYPWVEGELRARGKHISRPALKELVEACGTDRYLLQQQLEKLLLYIGDQPQIELDTVRLLVPRTESDVFYLFELIAARQAEGAYRQLQALLLREHPNKLISTLGTSMTRLFRTRWAAQQGQDSQAIASLLGLHPYVVKMDLQRWRSFSLEALEQGLQRLLSLQTRTRQTRLSPEQALEIWLGDMLQA